MSGSASVPSTVDANSATRCARITAPSGSYRYRRTGPTGAPDRPDPVRRTPDGSRVARRGTEASGPYQKQASTTSPSTDTHSASAPAGISAWSIPGASLSTVRGTRVESADTKSHGGEYAFGANTRPEPVRRAGSQNTPSTVDRSTVVASAHTTETREPRPSTATIADATAAVNGSAATASTRIPARAKASAYAPIPQPRSAITRTPELATRAARRLATARRVACSRPGRVKNIDPASAPNLPTAAARIPAWVRAAAARSGANPAARNDCAATNGPAPTTTAARSRAAAPAGVRSWARVTGSRARPRCGAGGPRRAPRPGCGSGRRSGRRCRCAR